MLRKCLHILSPVAAAWLLALAIVTFACGIEDIDAARLIDDARPENVRLLQVERLRLLSAEPEIWQAEGRLGGESLRHALTLEPADAARLVELGGRLPVIETGDAGAPLVTARWYEEQAMLRFGGVVVPLHLVLGALFAIIAFLQLARVRRHDRASRLELVQAGATARTLSPRQARLVARLERRAARDLRRYRRRVVAATALGFGFLIGVFVLLAGTLLIGIQVAFGASEPSPLPILLVVPAVAVAVLAALRVRAPAPDGEPVERSDAPALFACLDAIAARLGGPRFDRVLLTEDFNAAIVQRSRFRTGAWQRDDLLIGLPLMQALTVAQLEAVLAHEYGHVARAEGRFAGWVQRMRGTWLRLSGEGDERWRWIGVPLRRFFAWYGPWFSAHAAVLARHNELAADRLAAGLTSPLVMLDALATVAVRGRQLEAAFWPNVYDGARFQPDPPAAYRALGVAMKEHLAPDSAAAHLRAALHRRTGGGDTHPALIDRARALGRRVRLPPVPLETAAEALLGCSADDIVARFDARWAERCGIAWRATFTQAAHERALLAELESAPGPGTLSLEHRWCRARLTEQVHDAASAELIYREILADVPDHPPAHFALARLLLARGDTRGLAHLERAMSGDPEAVLPGCELAIHHLERLGRPDDAEGYRLRGAEARRFAAESKAERSGIALDDEVLPAELDAAAVAAIRDVIAGESGIARAWLVRKALRHARGCPVLIVIVRPGAATPPDAVMQERLSKALWSLRSGAEFWVVPDTAANAPLCRRARAIDGSAIFARPQAGACS